MTLEETMGTRALASPGRDGAAAQARAVPALAEGAELAGEFAGSGYREPPQLIYRSDGQVVRLPPLLYLVAKILDNRPPAAVMAADRQQILAHVAHEVSRQTGRQFTADHIAFLIDRKLAPLGVTTYSDGSPPDVPRANPFLSFRFRMALLPATATWFIAGLFSWLFRPYVLVPAIVGVMACESWVLGTQNIGTASLQTLLTPASILLVVVLAVASTAFHEVGHGTACRYSGARPGPTGYGIYLLWPVFYTDITNSYRLGRSGRLRTDLGGVYFNGLFVIGLTLLYLGTGFRPLLVAILATDLEIVQQLLPSLRFDGYYIVSDLVGIPDLFRYIGPILKRTLLRQKPDARLHALKRWPQIVLTLWVLSVVPALAVQLGIFLIRLPALGRTDFHMVKTLASHATASGSPVLGVASACVQILLLLLPVAGTVLIVMRLIRTLARAAHLRAILMRPLNARHRARMPVGAFTAALAACLMFPAAGLALAWVLTPSPPQRHPIAIPASRPQQSTRPTRPAVTPASQPADQRHRPPAAPTLPAAPAWPAEGAVTVPAMPARERQPGIRVLGPSAIAQPRSALVRHQWRPARHYQWPAPAASHAKSYSPGNSPAPGTTATSLACAGPLGIPMLQIGAWCL
jgi:putative peptide zinc metalloprotease protein